MTISRLGFAARLQEGEGRGAGGPLAGRWSRAVVAALAALSLVALACGPDEPDELRVRAGIGNDSFPFFRVIGTDLTKFRGQIGDSTGNRSVDGIVPQDFVLENARNFVSGSFTKTVSGRQALTAQLFVDGELRAEQTTNVEGGTVSVSAPIDSP